MNNKELFTEYLKIKRKYLGVNKTLELSKYPNKEIITSFNNEIINNLKAHYKYKIGKEFESMDLMADKIERAM